MSAFDDFKNKWENKPNVGNTAQNIGQCVGLVEIWIDAIGGPHIWGDAKDLYNNAPTDFFVQIEDTLTAIPQKGDIIVWSGSFNNGAGHTGIATGKADINSFDCFEQNDPLGSRPHVKNYNYEYVTGWLRPKNPIVETISVPKTDFENLVTKSSNWDIVAVLFKLDPLDKNGGKMVTDQVETLQKDLETCRTSITIQSPLNTPSGEGDAPSSQNTTGDNQPNSDLGGSINSPDNIQSTGDSVNVPISGDGSTQSNPQANFLQNTITSFVSKFRKLFAFFKPIFH